MNSKYLEKTKIVNFEHSTIQSLISERNWQELDDFNKIGAAYQFVKDEILGIIPSNLKKSFDIRELIMRFIAVSYTHLTLPTKRIV